MSPETVHFITLTLDAQIKVKVDSFVASLVANMARTTDQRIVRSRLRMYRKGKILSSSEKISENSSTQITEPVVKAAHPIAAKSDDRIVSPEKSYTVDHEKGQ